ncbi:MAG: hypothetical protein ACR2H3_12610 [Acidimicrobiales bacterium]
MEDAAAEERALLWLRLALEDAVRLAVADNRHGALGRAQGAEDVATAFAVTGVVPADALRRWRSDLHLALTTRGVGAVEVPPWWEGGPSEIEDRGPVRRFSTGAEPAHHDTLGPLELRWRVDWDGESAIGVGLDPAVSASPPPTVSLVDGSPVRASAVTGRIGAFALLLASTSPPPPGPKFAMVIGGAVVEWNLVDHRPPGATGDAKHGLDGAAGYLRVVTEHMLAGWPRPRVDAQARLRTLAGAFRYVGVLKAGAEDDLIEVLSAERWPAGWAAPPSGAPAHGMWVAGGIVPHAGGSVRVLWVVSDERGWEALAVCDGIPPGESVPWRAFDDRGGLYFGVSGPVMAGGQVAVRFQPGLAPGITGLDVQLGVEGSAVVSLPEVTGS